MKAIIDALSSATGWTAGTGSSMSASINQVPDFIAGLNNSASLIIAIPAGNSGKTISETISPSFDLTGYTEIVFHIWSRNLFNDGDVYNKGSDFAYQIDFGDGNVYYLPTFQGFNDVTLYVSGGGPITKINIKALTDDADYLIISNMLAVKDEIPVDIFRGLQEQLKAELLLKYASIVGGVTGKGILLGTVSAAAGDASIYNLNGYNYLEKYAVILIDDGSNSEIHQIDTNDNRNFSFTTLYDGAAIQHDHSGVNLYLIVPVEYGRAETEIVLPGIAIWGMSPEELLRTNKIEEYNDTFKADGTVISRLTPITFQYIIMLDCEARNNELIALMSLACRSVIGKQYFWMNGKKINIYPEGAGQYIEPAEGFDEIPKIQYQLRVEIKEEIYDRTAPVQALPASIDIEIQDGGTL
jgi:hypothetical protein